MNPSVDEILFFSKIHAELLRSNKKFLLPICRVQNCDSLVKIEAKVKNLRCIEAYGSHVQTNRPSAEKKSRTNTEKKLFLYEEMPLTCFPLSAIAEDLWLKKIVSGEENKNINKIYDLFCAPS